MEEVTIILVKPQLGENIGMAARAMLNFGMHSLRLVSPRSWPNEAAISSATHAARVIKRAKVFASMHEATADLKFLYATTARSRDMNKPVVSSVDLFKDIQRSRVPANKIGIIFGPENSGLDNEAISLSNKILSIPVGEEFASLNLAVAVGIVCYELAKSTKVQAQLPARNTSLASHGEVSNLLNHLETMLDAINFYQTPQKKKRMQQNIAGIFTRIEGLTSSETRTLMGIMHGLFKHRG